MRNLDILAAENGEHIRVLLCGEEQLRSRGWRSLTGGRTYATKIETALLNLYSQYGTAERCYR